MKVYIFTSFSFLRKTKKDKGHLQKKQTNDYLVKKSRLHVDVLG